MITTREMVILVTPPKAAAAPTSAYIPGVTQFRSVLHSVSKMYLRRGKRDPEDKVKLIFEREVEGEKR